MPKPFILSKDKKAFIDKFEPISEKIISLFKQYGFDNRVTDWDISDHNNVFQTYIAPRILHLFYIFIFNNKFNLNDHALRVGSYQVNYDDDWSSGNRLYKGITLTLYEYVDDDWIYSGYVYYDIKKREFTIRINETIQTKI